MGLIFEMLRVTSSSVERFKFFLGGLSLHLNHLIAERSLLAIWDTSHCNYFVKFGLKTA